MAHVQGSPCGLQDMRCCSRFWSRQGCHAGTRTDERGGEGLGVIPRQDITSTAEPLVPVLNSAERSSETEVSIVAQHPLNTVWVRCPSRDRCCNGVVRLGLADLAECPISHAAGDWGIPRREAAPLSRSHARREAGVCPSHQMPELPGCLWLRGRWRWPVMSRRSRLLRSRTGARVNNESMESVEVESGHHCGPRHDPCDLISDVHHGFPTSRDH
jgi:hypothetical protein